MSKGGEFDPDQYFNVVYCLRLSLNGRDMVSYVTMSKRLGICTHLYHHCPVGLREFLGSESEAGLNDENKIDMVQIYLHDKEQITFLGFKEAVIKAYRRIGRAAHLILTTMRGSSMTRPKLG